VFSFFAWHRRFRGQAAAEFRDRPTTPRVGLPRLFRASHGMIATDEELGSEAGLEILKRGGNAVDAAVAVLSHLPWSNPPRGNIGGGGFMLIRLANGKTTFLDYREVAPGKATPRYVHRKKTANSTKKPP